MNEQAFIIAISIITGSISIGIMAMVVFFFRNRKRGLSDRYKYTSLSFLCVLVALAGWVINMGNIRLTFAVPLLIHAILFFATTSVTSAKIKLSADLKTAVNRGVWSFLLTHLLLPDINSNETTYYMLFRLVRSDIAGTYLSMMSLLLFVFNIIVLVKQLVLYFKVREVEQ